MSRDPAAILGVIGGRPVQSTDAAVTPQIGRIRSVDARGVIFTLPDYDGGRHTFGPAPWNRGGAASTPTGAAGTTDPHTHPAHVHVAEPPPVEAECLVVFVGSGVERPVVVAWW